MTHLTPSVSNVVSHNVQNGTVKAATTAPNRTTRKRQRRVCPQLKVSTIRATSMMRAALASLPI